MEIEKVIFHASWLHKSLCLSVNGPQVDGMCNNMNNRGPKGLEKNKNFKLPTSKVNLSTYIIAQGIPPLAQPQ